MKLAQKTLLIFFVVLGMALPILVYGAEHGGLGSGEIESFRPMSASQQAAQVAAGLYIKPAYMLITVLLIAVLAGQPARPMRALFWGLIAFLIGETFCAVNFIVYRHQSLVSEYLHSYGMVLAFGLLTYSLLDVLDLRLHPSAHPVLSRQIALFSIPMTAILAFLPLTVSTAPTDYQTDLFGVSYSYARFGFYQWYESRLLPWIALACMAFAWAALWTRQKAPIPPVTKMFFSAGVGALGFAIFRVTLGALYAQDLVWFEFWEELTELMMVVSVTFILWQYQPELFAFLRLRRRSDS